MEKNFGFIIPSYCENELHLLQLNRCLSSIRKFHKDEKIIVINDYSIVNINEITDKFDNVEVVISPVKGAGDMMTYKVLRDGKYFDIACIIQDSMTIERKIDRLDTIDGISYLWYFTNHRVHWHTIMEHQDEFNIKNNIKTHDDLNLFFINNIDNKDGFKKYANNIYHQKNKWCGCFGCLSIVEYDFINKLDEETGVINLLSKMDNNRLRRSAESIFAIACQYVLGDKVFEKAYDGLYYDGITPPRNRAIISANSVGINSDVSLDQYCKTDYFSKIVFKRKE